MEANAATLVYVEVSAQRPLELDRLLVEAMLEFAEHSSPEDVAMAIIGLPLYVDVPAIVVCVAVPPEILRSFV